MDLFICKVYSRLSSHKPTGEWMKVEIEGSYVRIKGALCGNDRHLKIHCSAVGGEDYYSVSIVKDGMELCFGPSYFMNDNHVIEQTSLNGKRFIN